MKFSGLFAFYKTFLRYNKKWFIAAALWFFVCAIVGTLAFFERPELLDAIASSIRDAVEAAEGWDLVRALFVRNITVSLVAVAGGIIAGLVPFFVLSINGFVVGYVVTSVVVLGNSTILGNLLFSVLALLPHGVIELPAIILACAVGLRLGLNWAWQEINSGTGLVTFKQDLKNAVFSLPLIAVALGLAAIIEVFVTGYLVGA